MMAPMPSKSPAKRPAFMLSVTETDSASSASMSTPTSSSDAPKSQCSSLSDGESFEGFGENYNQEGGIDLELAPPHSTQIVDDENNSISRHTWARTSLRRTPTSTGRRQLGSNALASQLYRSSSFNSSGRSSNCDTTEDMYSDVSLEDVQDLNHKLEILQRQVTNLADSQNTVDDRTSRTKTEHAVLQARYHMLEEQLRDVELRADERILEEQKRHKELLSRVEREAILQNENCQIKIRTIEIEAKALKEENQRLRDQCTKQAYDLQVLEEKLESVRDNFIASQEEVLQAKHNEKKCLQDKLAAEDLMVELGKEVERLRSENLPALPTTSPEAIRLEELHQEMEDLRHAKKLLEEQNEELHAMVLNKGVEEGRHLLNGTSNSLAFELGEMNNREGSSTLASLTELQTAYQDKEDENQRLKHYIDTILLNIVENYPQLLEVKAMDSGKQ
ncbi:rab11 family-interacting protein 4B isoform X4 [Bradysia coprophila]|uniref:rab11 family-interacting protein 4B isoform X4 n=1 Tax=Bradysia coprophila TaxID=38358 RepID=UPI00187D8EEA|nr:rab11 family-interacting protein 4B isoform X4 [Bradysia coprophila]